MKTKVGKKIMLLLFLKEKEEEKNSLNNLKIKILKEEQSLLKMLRQLLMNQRKKRCSRDRFKKLKQHFSMMLELKIKKQINQKKSQSNLFMRKKKQSTIQMKTNKTWSQMIMKKQCLTERTLSMK